MGSDGADEEVREALRDCFETSDRIVEQLELWREILEQRPRRSPHTIVLGWCLVFGIGLGFFSGFVISLGVWLLSGNPAFDGDWFVLMSLTAWIPISVVLSTILIAMLKSLIWLSHKLFGKVGYIKWVVTETQLHRELNRMIAKEWKPRRKAALRLVSHCQNDLIAFRDVHKVLNETNAGFKKVTTMGLLMPFVGKQVWQMYKDTHRMVMRNAAIGAVVAGVIGIAAAATVSAAHDNYWYDR